MLDPAYATATEIIIDHFVAAFGHNDHDLRRDIRSIVHDMDPFEREQLALRINPYYVPSFPEPESTWQGKN